MIGALRVFLVQDHEFSKKVFLKEQKAPTHYVDASAFILEAQARETEHRVDLTKFLDRRKTLSANTPCMASNIYFGGASQRSRTLDPSVPNFCIVEKHSVPTHHAVLTVVILEAQAREKEHDVPFHQFFVLKKNT
jgi:hypothetical protein